MSDHKFINVLALLERANEDGIKISLEENELVVQIEKDREIDGLFLDELRNHKTHLIDYLKTTRQPASDQTPGNRIDPERRKSVTRIPLSFSQERLWFIDQLEGSVPYHIPTVLRLKGRLDRHALQHALQTIVNRHEVLRTVIGQQSGIAYQHILAPGAWQLEIVDEPLYVNNEAALQDFIKKLIDTPFDLAADHMLRAHLIILGAEEHILEVTLHHIASDGWSTGIIVQELVELYKAYIENRAPQLPELELQYADFAIWQQENLSGEGLEKQLSFWKQKLGGVAALQLPLDFPRPPIQSPRGAATSYKLDLALLQQLRTLSRQQGTTLFMTLLAAFKVLLHRYSGQDDICVGSPIAGRVRKEIEGLIGFFVNTLVLRDDLGNNPAFTTLLQQVKETTLHAYEHQDVPFEKIVDAVIENRDQSRPPLFQVAFVLQNMPEVPDLHLGEVEFSSVKTAQDMARYDMTVTTEEGPDGLFIGVEYCIDLFTKGTIDRMMGHFEQLLRSVVAAPATRIGSLLLLNNAEEQLLLHTFNNTETPYPTDASIVSLFAEHVTATPDAPALVHGNTTLTYRQLDERSNQLAHYLHGKGVKAETLVPICIDRSPEMIVSILGILKAGGAYVPVDPEYPLERINYILADTGAGIILTNENIIAKLRSTTHAVSIVTLDNDDIIGPFPKTPLQLDIKSTQLAYVIYTSGSTGQPKGVLATQKSLVNLIHCQSREYNIGRDERILLVSNYIFDASVEQIFFALLNGCALVLVDTTTQLDTVLFEKFLTDQHITHLEATPSFLMNLRPGTYGGLKRIVSGGELCRKVFADKWTGLVDFYNIYGPTETTVSAIVYRYTPDSAGSGEALPIGRPLANVKVYLLDTHGNPVPVGVTGELHIGGAGLTRGYLNRSDLTTAKFVSNPFSQELGTLMYKTGDLAKWLPDGNIEYLGRADDQVKVRGFRIELGEIENILQQSDLVDRIAVVAKGEDNNKRLVAYVVPAGAYDPEGILAYGKTLLPEYMLPSLMVELKQMPMTPGGKVDRKALPDPDVMGLQTGTHVEPRNPVEKKVAEIFEEVLEVSGVGVYDDFFKLGGDSIMVITLVTRIREAFDQEVKLFEVYGTPTVEQIARMLDNREVAEPVDTAVQELEKEIAALKEQVLSSREDAALIEDVYPMSDIQSGMVYASQINPELGIYHDQMGHLLAKGLDPVVMEKALSMLSQKHAILRTTFDLHSHKEGLQLVHKEIPVKVEYLDYGTLSDEEAKIRIDNYLKEERTRPLQMDKAPTWRATVFNLKEHSAFLFQCHHAIIDGWSDASFNTELNNLYLRLKAGEEVPPLEPLKCSYRDYVIEQIIEKRNAENREFWQQELAEYKRLNIFTQEAEDKRLVTTYEPAYLALLQQRTKEDGLTVKGLLFGAMLFALNMLTHEDEVTVGLVTNNRPAKEDGEKVIGCFLNSLPFRFQQDKLAFTWKTYFRQIENKLVEMKKRDRVSLPEIIKITGEQFLEGNPFFDVLFNFTNFHVYKNMEEGLAEEGPHELNNVLSYGVVNTYLTCNLSISGDVLVVNNSLKRKFKSGDSLEALQHYFDAVLTGYLEQYEAPVNRNAIHTAAELKQLMPAPAVGYPKQKNIVDLFTEQANRTPLNIAVVYEKQTLTYGELHERSSQLARYLRQQGVTAEMLVPVCIDRSVDMIVAILGILKAGAAYVPVDPSYPLDRIRYILEDTAATIVVSSSQCAEVCHQAAAGLNVVALDTDWDMISRESAAALDITIDPHHLAYVIYTSGSTGKPKGVLIEHVNVVRLFKTDAPLFDFTEADVWTMFHSFSFDFSVWEIYGALFYGGRLVVVPKEVTKDTAQFGELLIREGVTILNQTPSAFYALQDYLTARQHPTAIRIVVFGGEALNPSRIKPWRQLYPDCRLINMYGITETTVHVTFQELTDDQLDSSTSVIGKPIPTLYAYILNKYQALTPVGVAGELYVGGMGVAREYLNRPALSAGKFIADPFIPGNRLYRTGDLGRWLPDGTIEYLGRIDDQVKIRGFRIELGEIESALLEYEAVSKAIVLNRPDRNGNGRLVGYVVPQGTFDKNAILAYLRERLPEYMVPSLLVELDHLPLTINGKIDKKALPDPDEAALLASLYVAPRNESEQQLADIWKELLGVEQVGIHDNFFERGGHSLSATRLISILRNRLAAELSIRDLFLHPTIASLAARLHQQDKNTRPAVTVIERPAHIPLSFSQERLWFIDRLEGSIQYHIPAVLKLKGALDISALEYAFQQIVNRHEVLRTVIREEKGKPYQLVLAPDTWQLDVRLVAPAHKNEAKLKELINALFEVPFSLTADHMLRAHLLVLDKEEYILQITQHHIAADGWSTGIIVGELVALYNALVSGNTAVLPPLPVQYADYALWQRNYLSGEVLDTQLSYWEQQLSATTPLQLPTDHKRPPVQPVRGDSFDFKLDKTLSARLKTLSQQQGTTLFMTLLAAFKVLLYRYSGQEDICIGTPVAGRTQQELEGLVGFFINTLALRSQLRDNLSFTDLLQTVKETTLTAYDNQDVPFEKIVERVMKVRDLSRTPLFQVMFVLQNLPESAALQLGSVSIESEEVAHSFAQFDLSLSVQEDGEGLSGSIVYCADLFDAATIGRMTRHFSRLLEAIVQAPATNIHQLSLLSQDETQQLLYSFNSTYRNYPANKTLTTLLAEQVARTPDAVALVFEGNKLSYRELDERSNQLAHYLVRHGVGTETLVPICLDRSFEMVIGIWGILKAGGAYVPIDPEYPAERIRFMLADINADLLLSTSAHTAVINGTTGTRQTILLDAEWTQIAGEPISPVKTVVQPQQLAYVIYTSGSTGVPKGVMNEHAGVVNRLLWAQEYFALTAEDAVLQKTTFCFDVSVWELIWPSLVGARLVLAAPGGQKEPAYLKNIIAQEGITTIHFVPSMLDLFLEQVTAGEHIALRRVICSGEALKPQQVNTFRTKLPVPELYNLYGPTEAAIDVTYWQAPKTGADIEIVPIGKPVANTRLYVLDKSGNIVPPGGIGELHIGGIQVARGYLNRRELTAEKFVPDTFSQQDGARRYKTGDLVKWQPDGNLEYIGRIDDQVKIRGYRIELGEIENVLQGHDAVSQAVVVAQKNAVTDQYRLIGYVVPRNKFDRQELLTYLSSRLPDYMTPSLLIELEAIPLTTNGKIDKQALPVPDTTALTAEDYVAPRNETEQLLVDIWQELLGVSRIGTYDNFFTLGGHSLLAMRLIAEVSEVFGVELSVRTIFQLVTVEALAKYIKLHQLQQQPEDDDADIIEL
ncbi:non-ribosomal peptide synthetase [Chitinophaga qingshengii]|uniref:Amino acid adenylation domain-containing protein n=1 Tax=Chitinophaga qingshengii TaxID=1569794 RepID=A0ABR7TFN0_9BACT|nr:non-ribosomal peptide synthetase [Chitinophaga qingshengii]MBC9929147.1 amino acid adenylation domain-containing protein [Chitinophaga qingshengii]